MHFIPLAARQLLRLIASTTCSDSKKQNQLHAVPAAYIRVGLCSLKLNHQKISGFVHIRVLRGMLVPRLRKNGRGSATNLTNEHEDEET